MVFAGIYAGYYYMKYNSNVRSSGVFCLQIYLMTLINFISRIGQEKVDGELLRADNQFIQAIKDSHNFLTEAFLQIMPIVASKSHQYKCFN